MLSAVVVQGRNLDLVDPVLPSPRGERPVQRGADAPKAVLREHGDDREDAVNALREDDGQRGAGCDSVEPRDDVVVIAHALLERVNLRERERRMRPHCVVDVERDLLVALVGAGDHLQHAATIRMRDPPRRARYGCASMRIRRERPTHG